MFAIEFKEKNYVGLEEHLHNIIENAKLALHCLEYSKHDDSNSKPIVNVIDDKPMDRYHY